VTEPAEGPRIETLLLADWAEAINGKLYVMGGGFTTLALERFDRPARFALGAILSIPSPLRGRPIPVHGHVETAGGERLESWAVTGQLVADPDEVANPDGTAVLAGPVDLQIDAPADLVLRLRFGDDERAARFRVIAAGE
jgi:hypothetical protein